MKTTMKILMILTFALYAVTAAGQSECKVLLPALSGADFIERQLGDPALPAMVSVDVGPDDL